jgi:hypothetical protein
LSFAILNIVCRHFLQPAFELQKPNIVNQHYNLSKIYLSLEAINCIILTHRIWCDLLTF